MTDPRDVIVEMARDYVKKKSKWARTREDADKKSMIAADVSLCQYINSFDKTRAEHTKERKE